MKKVVMFLGGFLVGLLAFQLVRELDFWGPSKEVRDLRADNAELEKLNRQLSSNLESAFRFNAAMADANRARAVRERAIHERLLSVTLEPMVERTFPSHKK